VDTLELIVGIAFLVLITLLPQIVGVLAYLYLRRKVTRLWAGIAAIALPPLCFFAVLYPYVRSAAASAGPSEYWMAVGFGILLLYSYLILGTGLNLFCGLVIQLVLLYRRHRQPRPNESLSILSA
jgi:hypothetical protein